MKNFDANRIFSGLLAAFDPCFGAADALETPNEEDTFNIRLAIVGFSYYSPTENWSADDYEFVDGRLQTELSDTELREHGEVSKPFQHFAALALGALRGIRCAGTVDETSLSLADAQLPGFMYLHLPKIAALKTAA